MRDYLSAISSSKTEWSGTVSAFGISMKFVTWQGNMVGKIEILYRVLYSLVLIWQADVMKTVLVSSLSLILSIGEIKWKMEGNRFSLAILEIKLIPIFNLFPESCFDHVHMCLFVAWSLTSHDHAFTWFVRNFGFIIGTKHIIWVQTVIVQTSRRETEARSIRRAGIIRISDDFLLRRRQIHDPQSEMHADSGFLIDKLFLNLYFYRLWTC